MGEEPTALVPVSHNRGRRCTYTAEVAEVILERLAEGQSLLSICRDPTLPPESTVRQWVLDDREGFAARYARARDMGLDHVGDEIVEIVDEETDPVRARVRMDARRWYLSKLAPKRYGDKLAVEHAGPNGGPIQTITTEMTPKEAADAYADMLRGDG